VCNALLVSKPEKPFEIQFTITYPQPLPNAMSDYPASSSNATIALPANLSLVQGKSKEKPIVAGLLNASDSNGELDSFCHLFSKENKHGGRGQNIWISLGSS
jgi:hypothetical protein